MNEPSYYLLSAVAILIALTVHEFAHAFVATKLGDPTSTFFGRYTLNPLRHIDPIGAIAMLLLGIGWAKPVPINPSYFKHPKRGMALTAIAGPISNILLAFLSSFLFVTSFYLYSMAIAALPSGTFALKILYYLVLFFQIFLYINLSLAIFNFLPISPLDGSRLLYLILPPRPYRWFVEHERYIYFGVLAWLILGDRFYAMLLRVDLIASSGALRFIASLFAPTVWITAASEALAALMLRFWTLLPFFS